MHPTVVTESGGGGGGGGRVKFRNSKLGKNCISMSQGLIQGGWIGCLVTPYGLNCRREQLKIGNHAVRHVQCARFWVQGMEIQMENW